MWKLIVRRILIMIPQIFLVSIIIFALADAMPGDSVSNQIGSGQFTAEEIEKLREERGLNDPMHIQYINWAKGLLEGDLGYSYAKQRPVTELLGDKIVNTVFLSLVTTLITYAIALPLGLISGRYNDTAIDKAILGYNYVGFATPIFIFGLIMLFIFGFNFGLFPTGGSVDPLIEKGTFDYYVSKLYHVMLPALSTALIAVVGTVQYLRSEVLDTKVKDYVRTARAKGLPERKLYTRHIFRNASLPIAAFAGYELTLLISGNIIIESMYSYPGMGQLFLESLTLRDYPVVTAIIIIGSVAIIIGTLLSDIIVSLVDPRVRID